jgi:hypothetical protein
MTAVFSRATKTSLSGRNESRSGFAVLPMGIPLAICLLVASRAAGTIVVTTEIRSHFAPDNVGRGLILTPPFSVVPNLRDDDYADILSRNGVVVTMLNGVLNYDSGPPSRLINGFWQPVADDPGNSAFFENDRNGEFLFDLNGLVKVTEVNSYSRHVDGRTPQKYTLYGSGEVPAPSTIGNLELNGWQRLANVDMRSEFVAFDGVAGANIQNSTGSLGTFRYLLFDIHGVGNDGGFGTFYGEIDIVGTQVPEPDAVGLILLGTAFIGSLRRPRQAGGPHRAIHSELFLTTCVAIGRERGQACSVEKQSVPRCRQESTARMLGIFAASEPLA